MNQKDHISVIIIIMILIMMMIKRQWQGQVHILVKGTITVSNSAAQGAALNNTNKKVIFKNCTPFSICKSK